MRFSLAPWTCTFIPAHHLSHGIPRCGGAAEEAAAADFSGIVVKSHHHSMVTDVLAVDAAMGGLPLPVFSGIPLNSVTDGLNPAAVDLTLKMGGRAAWFSTISARKHMCLHEELNFPGPAIPVRAPDQVAVLDADDKVLPEAWEILELIRDSHAISMTGHSDAGIVDRLIDGAIKVRVDLREAIDSCPAGFYSFHTECCGAELLGPCSQAPGDRRAAETPPERPTANRAGSKRPVPDTDGKLVPGARASKSGKLTKTTSVMSSTATSGLPDAPTSTLTRTATTPSGVPCRPRSHPHDGPDVKLLKAAHDSPVRASHLHVMVTAEDLRTIVTHILVKGDRKSRSATPHPARVPFRV